MTSKKIIGVILAIIFSFLLSACNGSKNKSMVKNPSLNNIDAPDWFIKPISANNYIISYATAKSTHADFAIKKGLQNAYSEMSRIVQAHLDGKVEYLVKEYGNTYYSKLESASQLISRNTIAGVRIIKQDISQNGIYYTAYFMAAIPTTEIYNSFKKQISKIKGLKIPPQLFNIKKNNTNLFAITNLKKIDKEYTYPNWFTHPPKGKIVGYANKAYYSVSGSQAAIENGVWNYLLFNKNIISGSISNVLAKEQDFLAQDNVKEQIDTLLLENIYQKLIPLDTSEINNLCLVLLGKNKEKIEKRIEKIKTMPDWLINIPEKKGYAYTVGIAPNYHYEKSSWLEAEADARKKLALRQQLYIETYSSSQKSKYQEVNRINVNAKIEKAEIISRFRNKHLMFVLIKMPLNW